MFTLCDTMRRKTSRAQFPQPCYGLTSQFFSAKKFFKRNFGKNWLEKSQKQYEWQTWQKKT